VVVATRDRSDRLLATLAKHRELSGPVPTVVVDNASSDGTPGLVRQAYPEVAVVALPRNLGAAARTVGARRLVTPLVAFSDDDSWWSAGALQRAAEVFDAHPRLGLLASRTLVGPDQRIDPTCEVMADSRLPRNGPLPGPALLGFVACGAVVRRQAFLDLGGFHPRLWIGGEETLVALDLAAAGWDLAYVDDVVTHHHPDERPRAGRSVAIERNALWTAWLRLPAAVVARETATALTRALRDRDARAGFAQAIRGLPWVVRERQRVPAEVAAAYAAL
jgi:N-acetylglucosaminyl-diphospho-decaprenol L-rhamnosyltransferase